MRNYEAICTFVGFRSNLEEVSRFAIETTEKKGRARKLAWHR